VNAPTLTPDQRLERAIAFLSRLQPTQAAADRVIDALTEYAGTRPQLGSQPWNEILAALIGAGEELWDTQAKETLDKRVNAAWRQVQRSRLAA
jgi:hypothetical protein